MNRLIIPAFSVLLLASLPSMANAVGYQQLAQNDHQDDQKKGGGKPDDHAGPPKGGDQHGPNAQGGNPQDHAQGPKGGPQAHGNGTPQGQANGGQPNGGQPNGGKPNGGKPNGGQGQANGQNHTVGSAVHTQTQTLFGGNNQGRGGDQHANDQGRGDNRNHFGEQRPTNLARANANNVHNFHRDFKATQRFHIAAYHRPPGYHYRRWNFGQILPALYFGQDYWIDDYSDYGLDVPPPGYTWVRYGPDALLVDEYSGEIIEVEYGIYY